MPPSPRRDFKCSVCDTAFRRAEHLQRHLATHSDGRPFDCRYCGVTFKRRDVMTRHMRTCQTRKSKTQDNGPKVVIRVCDDCVTYGNQCSGDYPCQVCIVSGRICTYWSSDTQADTSALRGSISSLHNPAPLLASTLDSESLEISPPHLAIPFRAGLHSLLGDLINGGTLNRFDAESTSNNALERTDSHSPDPVPLLEQYGPGAANTLAFFERQVNQRGGLVETFVCGTQLERRQALRQLSCHNGETNEADLPAEPMQLDTGEEAWAAWVSTIDSMMRTEAYALPEKNDPNEALVAEDTKDQENVVLNSRCDEILARIKEVVDHRRRNSVIKEDWSVQIEDACKAFFDATNLRKFITMYWLFWYPNCSIIHRPSFDMATVSVTLLLSMVLIGASVSPDECDRTPAKIWLDMAEEVVFGDEWLFEGNELPLDTAEEIAAGWKRLEALQAAYNLCVLQTWEGSAEAFRRIRRHRFTFVVAVARDRAISLSHQRFSDDLDEKSFDWPDFIARECIIRTVTNILLLDTYFVIFTNTPPRMIISEMDVELVLPEPCFQASTASECFHQLELWKTSPAGARRLTIASLVAMICREPLQGADLDYLVNTNVTNMLTCVLSLHSLIFYLQASSVCQVDTRSCMHALYNWKAAWDLRNVGTWDHPTALGSSPHDLPIPVSVMWKRIGFMRHARDYWLLGVLSVERTRYRKLANDGGKTNVQDKAVKIDDASMKAVGDLVMGLRSLQLQI